MRRRNPILMMVAVLSCAGLRVAGAAAGGGEPAAGDAGSAAPATATTTAALLAEALRNSPEIAAARDAADAARQRIAPAAALEDPMLEAGIVNAPLPFNLRREDMTMKMLGLTQRLPYPGKRALRRDVASADAAGLAFAVDETVDRVLRDVRVGSEELALATTSQHLLNVTLAAVGELAAGASARMATGQGSQDDALQAQIQLARLQQDLLRAQQDRQVRASELRRLLGRGDDAAAPDLPPAALLPMPEAAHDLVAAAQAHRPQQQALAAMIGRGDAELALARREYYPDFELRLAYGQRDRTIDGQPRDDMVTFTVAVNLPLWRTARLEPRVAEALARRRQAEHLAEALRLEDRAALERELATAQLQRATALLFRTTLAPQAEASCASTLSAYRVGRAGLAAVLEARMRMVEIARGEAEAIAAHNKAIAEIDLLTGRTPQQLLAGQVQP